MKNIFSNWLLIFFIIIATTGYCQHTIPFKGRLVHLNGDKNAVKRVEVSLLDQGTTFTHDDGTFTIDVKDNVSEVTLVLLKSKWAVNYPTGGNASIPRNPETITDFIIGESTIEILTKALARSNNEIENRLKQMGVGQKGIEETLNAFLSEVQKLTKIKASDLRNEIEVADKKEQFYPIMAATITNYINEAKDLKDAFKFVARHAFDDPMALQVLIDAVNNYNTAFEKLNNEHKGYERRVNDLWQSEAKTTEVRELFNYALGELHSANIFTLNLKLRDINEYLQNTPKGTKGKIMKDSILKEIEFTGLQLERRLEELDNRTQIVLNRLII